MPTRTTVAVAAGLATAAALLAAGPRAGAATVPPPPGEAALDCAALAEAFATATEAPPEIATFVALAESLPDALINATDPPLTVFIPVEEAFAAIPANVLDSIREDEALVTSIVDYHVVPGVALTAADLAATTAVESAIGAPIAVSVDGGTIVLNGGAATVVCPDVGPPDIAVHLIDAVLQPPAGAGGSAGSSVPGSSTPGSSVPGGVSFDADQQAAATAWETVVDSSSSFDEVAPFLEDAEALRATIEAYPAAADVVGGITATVTAVAIDGDTATVRYTVSFAGVETPYGELEATLVRADGSWMVPADEYCAVQSYARNACAA